MALTADKKNDFEYLLNKYSSCYYHIKDNCYSNVFCNISKNKNFKEEYLFFKIKDNLYAFEYSQILFNYHDFENFFRRNENLVLEKFKNSYSIVEYISKNKFSIEFTKYLINFVFDNFFINKNSVYDIYIRNLCKINKEIISYLFKKINFTRYFVEYIFYCLKNQFLKNQIIFDTFSSYEEEIKKTLVENNQDLKIFKTIQNSIFL